MKPLFAVAVTLFALALTVSPLQAKTICTVIADARSGAVLLQQGDCGTRYTPASTFKLPLSVMGYDAAFLTDEHGPVLAFHEGDPDWGGAPWRQPTDPTRWLKYSVVWYSQRIAHALGEARLHAYAASFGFGNADFAGDPGQHNGLDRAWIGSSLKVSPLEQVAFLKKLVNHELPATRRAQDMTLAIAEKFSLSDGGEVQGKTGMAYPRLANGELDEEHPYGWYVGWTSKGARPLVFARLVQEETKQQGSSGVRVRNGLLAELPALVAGLPH